jgi:hypothetical protein
VSALERVAGAVLGPPVRLAERAGIGLLDAALSSPVTDQAVNMVLDSPLVERALVRVLQGPLIDALAPDIARLADRLLAAGIADDIAQRLLDGPELERIVAAAMESQGAERLMAAALDSPGAERLVAATLASPGVARLGDRVLDSPQAERLVARVIESKLVDEAVARLLESKDLWLLVDEIARSPSVTQAISHQGVGFAEEMAGVVRERSQKADARVERIARRLFRREVVDGGGT